MEGHRLFRDRPGRVGLPDEIDPLAAFLAANAGPGHSGRGGSTDSAAGTGVGRQKHLELSAVRTPTATKMEAEWTAIVDKMVTSA